MEMKDLIVPSGVICVHCEANRCVPSTVHFGKKKGSARYLPYCQPFRDIGNKTQIIPQWQKDMAQWADKKWIFRTCEFEDFEPRKGFKCKEYFK